MTDTVKLVQCPELAKRQVNGSSCDDGGDVKERGGKGKKPAQGLPEDYLLMNK